MFIRCEAKVENLLDGKIKRLRSDRCGDYDTTLLKSVCEKEGTIHETATPYKTPHNGIAEKNFKDMMNAN